MSALAGYLTSVHPRRQISYRNAAIVPEELQTILFHSSSTSHYPLPDDNPSFAARKRIFIEIDITAIIGDPMLSSAAWIGGTQRL
jgi:hypothetical protein